MLIASNEQDNLFDQSLAGHPTFLSRGIQMDRIFIANFYHYIGAAALQIAAPAGEYCSALRR
jgi:hypothetical protein